ncbi:AMP-binding protein [Actinomadura flavalba]|uniref:AMP-binding protein n=1 Tax=Actinomadura flavalba TaxID=1120938 RepID=UPI000370C79D|nr:AMP-binding protein [Actinomadura flavalba]
MTLLGDGADVRVGEERLARAELFARAGAVAARVAGARVVAVHAEASASTVVAVVGGLLAGVPVVPVPPDSGPDERAHILGDSGAELLLGRGAALPGDGPERLPVDGLGHGDVASGEPPPDATALILYTSGTTGAPKGVLLSRRAVAAGLDALAEAWEWTAGDVVVHGLPLFHVHGLVLGVLGALRAGSPLVHTVRPRPEAYARAAREHGGSLYFGVPTVWSRVGQDASAAAGLRGARLLVSGSAPLPAPVFERLAARTGHRPVERYGMTETLITVSARAAGERVPGHVGTPLPGVRTRLAAEDGTPVPADGETPGELQLRAPTLFDGYLGRPDATAAAFTADGWFRTGDIAAVRPDGVHRIVGRASTDLIKSGGYRIGAGEVEDALLAHPAVREAAVVGTPHPDLGEQVTAFVVADGVTPAALTDFVAARLSAHKRPRTVLLRETLPRNAMGKVVKSRLV